MRFSCVLITWKLLLESNLEGHGGVRQPFLEGTGHWTSGYALCLEGHQWRSPGLRGPLGLGEDNRGRRLKAAYRERRLEKSRLGGRPWHLLTLEGSDESSQS